MDSLIQKTNLKTNVDKWIKTIHTQYHIKSLRNKFKVGEDVYAPQLKVVFRELI